MIMCVNMIMIISVLFGEITSEILKKNNFCFFAHPCILLKDLITTNDQYVIDVNKNCV